MGSKKGRVERLVYHDLIYLSRGRSTPKLVSGMGLTHIKGIRIEYRLSVEGREVIACRNRGFRLGAKRPNVD